MRPPTHIDRNLSRPRLRRPGLLRELLGTVLLIAAVLVASELALPRSRLDGPSMQPTLFAGQQLLVSRLDYLFGDPQRGDIVVFDKPNTGPEDEMLIKRVIGIPGDTIELRDQQVYRNGVLLDEPYFVNAPCNSRKCPNQVWILGVDEYFVMGDNRNHSVDSRDFDAVTRDRIVGKAIWRYWPLNQFGSLYD